MLSTTLTSGESFPLLCARQRAKQFAVVNLHRDSFSEAVSWTSGDAQNVVCDPDWMVDAEVELTNGYRSVKG